MASMSLLAALEIGPYISWWKPLPVIALLLIWTRLLTWADKDSIYAHLPREWLNTGNLVGVIVGFLAFLLVPNYGVGISVMVFLFAAEAGVYLLLRNQKVGLKDIGEDLKAFMSGKFGGREKVVEVAEGEVMLMDGKGTPMPPPEAEAPEAAAYEAVQKLLGPPLKVKAERIDLVPEEGAASIKYLVDGFPYSGSTIGRDAAAGGVTLIKTLAGMDVADKRKPQKGKMNASAFMKKRELEVHTRGSSAGESLSIFVDPKKRYDFAVDTSGFTHEQIETITEQIPTGGIVLVAAPKGHGLTTLLYSLIRKHDAFLSNILTVERDPDIELEGIRQNSLADRATPDEEVKLVSWVTSQEPDVLMMSRVDSPDTAKRLIQFAGQQGKRVYVGMRAANTLDAITMWRKLVGDDKAAAKQLRMAIAARLVRKLCSACKVGYKPDSETLRKLNMNPEKVGTLYQARTQALRDPKGNAIVCEFCHDVRFTGRVGVYELLVIDEETQSMLSGGGSTSQLKSMFRKQRRKLLQEQALVTVETGETSIEEVIRVLKAGTTSTSSKSSSAPPPSAPATA